MWRNRKFSTTTRKDSLVFICYLFFRIVYLVFNVRTRKPRLFRFRIALHPKVAKRSYSGSEAPALSSQEDLEGSRAAIHCQFVNSRSKRGRPGTPPSRLEKTTFAMRLLVLVLLQLRYQKLSPFLRRLPAVLQGAPLSGDEGARTPDFRLAKAALSQLSYIPRPSRAAWLDVWA
jgi:hypothetical protein